MQYQVANFVAGFLTELQVSNTPVFPPSSGAGLQTGRDLDRSAANHTQLLRVCAPQDGGH